jgi:hypothetical protein
MPRQPHEYRAVHEAADRIEPRLARAFERAVLKLRGLISINELAMRLAARDVKGAMRLLTKEAVQDALGPSATIVRDAVLKGGRLGAEAVNKEGG